jgi:SHS2 domain-containing protein
MFIPIPVQVDQQRAIDQQRPLAPSVTDISLRFWMAEEDIISVDWPVLAQRACFKVVASATDHPRNPRAALDPAAARQTTAQFSPRGPPPETTPGGWEYLDHTADVQIHAWGSTTAEAFAAAAQGMFGYMVELAEIGHDLQRTVVASGHDWESMLFAFLDECLYVFHTESLAMTRIVVDSIDTTCWMVTASVTGGLFDSSKHKQGTEVKAITYSNMQILHPDTEASRNAAPEKRAQIYVIVDI